jgi:hypothetical protein
MAMLFCHAVPGDDAGRVDLVLDQLVRALEKLGCEDHNGRRAVPNLLVLKVGELHEDLGSWVLDLQHLQNRSAIVGDADVPNVVDKHLVEAHRP